MERFECLCHNILRPIVIQWPRVVSGVSHRGFEIFDDFCFWLIRDLNQCKIDKKNQKLLEIRRQCVREQSKLQAAGKKAVKDQSETQTVSLKIYSVFISWEKQLN